MSKIDSIRRNLTLAGLFDKDGDYGDMLGTIVINMYKALTDYRHSGCSQALTMEAFNLVVAGKALTKQWWDEEAIKLRNLADNSLTIGVTADDDSFDCDAFLVTCLGKRPIA